jgi:hypothetical protein
MAYIALFGAEINVTFPDAMEKYKGPFSRLSFDRRREEISRCNISPTQLIVNRNAKHNWKPNFDQY